MDPMQAAFAITICILCACVVGTMMLVLFVKNNQVQRSNEELVRENTSLRRENKRLREEMSRRPMRLAAKLPGGRRGW